MINIPRAKEAAKLSKWHCGQAHLMIERLIDIRVKDRWASTLEGEQPQQQDVCPQGHIVLLQYWPFCFLVRLSRSHPVVTAPVVSYWHVFSIVQRILSLMATHGKFNHQIIFPVLSVTVNDPNIICEGNNVMFPLCMQISMEGSVHCNLHDIVQQVQWLQCSRCPGHKCWTACRGKAKLCSPCTSGGYQVISPICYLEAGRRHHCLWDSVPVGAVTIAHISGCLSSSLPWEIS